MMISKNMKIDKCMSQKMQVYRLINEVIDRHLNNTLGYNVGGLRIITGSTVDDSLIDEVNTVFNGLATMTCNGNKLTLTRKNDWDVISRHILEHINIEYLAKSIYTNKVNKFIRCLVERRDAELDISLGYFLEDIYYIMLNKSIKKMNVYKCGSVYKFNGQRFDMTRYRGHNDILMWEYDMKAIGWVFINGVGINRTEKIMQLADIIVVTTD